MPPPLGASQTPQMADSNRKRKEMRASVGCAHRYVPAFHPFCESIPLTKVVRFLIKSGRSSGNSKYPLESLKENLIPITEIYWKKNLTFWGNGDYFSIV